MKNRNVALLILALICSVAVYALAYDESHALGRSDIEIAIDIPAASYMLGETIPIAIAISNQTSQIISLPDAEVEGILIQISLNENNNYQNYFGQGRGFTVDGIFPPIEIGPMKSFIKRKTILWNYKPDVSHLNSDVAKPMLEKRILSDYAFTTEGTYFIRASIAVQEKGKVKIIESEPVQITIKEPAGEDLEVWIRIKDNGDIGYFLQEGDFPRGLLHKPEKCEKFQREIEQILVQYPNSKYSESFRQSRSKLKANEAKRREFKEKYQIKNP